MVFVKVLNYNVSQHAICGTRQGLYVVNNRVILSSRDSIEKKANLPGSHNYQTNLPFDNIVRYLSTVYLDYDIIHLVEANQRLIGKLKPAVEKTHQILRFWQPDTVEAIYLLVRKGLKIVNAFSLTVSSLNNENKARPICIVVFSNFVFVGVHLPHPDRHDPSGLNLFKAIQGCLEAMSLDGFNIIMTGDFNNESLMTSYYNSPFSLKTCFCLVPYRYFKSGEYPLTYSYDRFVCKGKLQLLEYGLAVDEQELSLHLSGVMSDHLPVNGLLQIEVDKEVESFSFETGVVDLEGYRFVITRDVGVPDVKDGLKFVSLV